MNLIEKIKKAELCGRGGAAFPTGKKWEMVRDAQGEKKYVIANGSEGEPGVFKDSYILENNPEKLIKGVSLAMEFVGAEMGYIYLRKDLYEKYKTQLSAFISDNQAIKITREDGEYLCGEETTLLNSMEKKRNEPRLKPPFPTTCGLHDCPTIINNIETFYRVAEIEEGTYQNKRFYSLSGIVKNKGVFELDVDLTIDEVLKQTNNYPETEFFVQSGGGGAGAVLTQKECKDALLKGAGALVVHDINEDPHAIFTFWTDFFLKNSCGQCIPCREGFFRMHQMLKEDEINYELMRDILEVMADTSFCGLGQYAPEGYLNYMEKVLKV